MKCRHFGNERFSQRRGLCFTCRRTPAISRLYPSASKYAPGHEPTEEELNEMIAENYPTMPPRRIGEE